MVKRTGGCACGAVRYEVEGEPIASFVCHCTDCQRATGGAPSYGMLFPADGFKVTKGSPRSRRVKAESGKGITRNFCGDCGSPLFAELELLPNVRDIPVGGLDDQSLYKPGMNMWVKSARPWHILDPKLPKFDGNPPAG